MARFFLLGRPASIKVFLFECCVLLLTASALSAAEPQEVATGLKNPESVAVGTDGRIYVSEVGEFNRDGDGRIMVIVDGQPQTFAEGLNDPKGLAAFANQLFATDKDRVVAIDAQGMVTTLADAQAFPEPPQFLNDVEVDEKGNLYVTDSGNLRDSGSALYRVTPKGEVEQVVGGERSPVKVANGVLNDGLSFMLVADMANGTLNEICLADGQVTKVAEGLGRCDGVTRDWPGRVYVTEWNEGRIFVIPQPGEEPKQLASGLKGPADLCLDPSGQWLLVPEMQAGRLVRIPATVPGEEVDTRPLPIATEPAFVGQQWSGWDAEPDSGLPVALRPIVLTHAGDESGRTFVATQRGIVHAFPKDGSAKKTSVFLDISDRVTYNDNMNEEGFLGFAFHPKFKENGEVFAYYTSSKAPPHTSVISRFRVSSDDPNRVDPDSEQEILRLPQPYWNHNGGTICFGPDGYLYIGLGDGGLANDPHKNGQNLQTWLGSVLRIDVDQTDGDKQYAVPSDNPFVGQTGAAPEIWAYGLRNIWRLSFDRETGTCWAGDVGQNLWEEIILLRSGGNYGWNLRESRHPFGPHGSLGSPELIEPIWEYPHSIGKSITGGFVYRGKQLPELTGAYIYGDYVSGRIWALWYDDDLGRVVANRPIADRALPILSFGEDEDGEIYLLTTTLSGEGVYRFVQSQDIAK